MVHRERGSHGFAKTKIFFNGGFLGKPKVCLRKLCRIHNGDRCRPLRYVNLSRPLKLKGARDRPQPRSKVGGVSVGRTSVGAQIMLYGGAHEANIVTLTACPRLFFSPSLLLSRFCGVRREGERAAATCARNFPRSQRLKYTVHCVTPLRGACVKKGSVQKRPAGAMVDGIIGMCVVVIQFTVQIGT